MSSCPDCPHLDADRQRSNGITPRAACCIDNLPGHRALAERMAAAKKAGEGLPRQQRRAAQRTAQKKGYP